MGTEVEDMIAGDEYLQTLAKMEPDIAAVDLTAAGASIAISLRRIADALSIISNELIEEKAAEDAASEEYRGKNPEPDMSDVDVPAPDNMPRAHPEDGDLGEYPVG